MQATITSKGQVTVPKKVREQLHLSPGDKIEFLVEENGTVRVVPVTAKVTQLKGMVPKPRRVVSVEEMDKAVARGAARR